MAFSLDTLHSFAREGGLQTLLVAAAILIITAIVSHMVAKGLRQLLMHDEVALPSSSIFVNIARATLWVLGLCVALSTCFGIDVSAAVAALGVGGIALSLGFKDTASNLIGGLQVSLMGLVVPGDNIRVGTSSGVVEDVSWRQTVVRTVDGQQIIIPNSIINTAALEKPHFVGLANKVVAPTDVKHLAGHDIVVLALPHGASGAITAALEKAAPAQGATSLLIDCGADHRLTDSASWTAFYGEHSPYAEAWTYGSAIRPRSPTLRMPSSRT